MNTLTRYKFHLIWLAAAALALILYFFWNTHANFLGIVETRTHKLGAVESGRIATINPALGQRVKANEVLAELDTTDLDIQREALERELARLRETITADQHRYTLEYEKLLLQRNEDKRRLAAKKAELQALNAEIKRLTDAEQQGLGRSRELSDLIIRRDSAARYISEESTGTGSSRRLASSMPTGAEPVVLSMLSEHIEHINELETKLRIVEERIRMRKVVSPCDGVVVKINYLPGDTVEGLATILTVEEPTAAFVDVYIPETADRKPQLGERVTVYPRRKGVLAAKGTIIFIDPGYSAVPERLAFRRIIYWARKFRVRLDDRHGLMPGETAEVQILGELNPLNEAQAEERITPSLSDLHHSPARTVTISSMSEIDVSDQLHLRSRFEPSGIAWLPDLDRFVVISDDTSRDQPEHAPWLYLMDRNGRVEPEPVTVAGVDSLNDVEAITVADDGTLYLISSQSISRKGKRPADRQRLLQVKREGRNFRVVAHVDFFTVMQQSYDMRQLAALGLTDLEGEQLVLNIEGATWRQGELLLGLKLPLTDRGAIIWRLQNPEQLFAAKTLSPDQLSLFAYVDLRTPDSRIAGISDLATDKNGLLYALATIPDAGDGEQCGGLFHLVRENADTMRAVALYSFPSLKPEGLCLTDDDSFTVVIDSDDRSPYLFFSEKMVRP